MGSIETKKPHLVVVPFPAQGHVNPMMTFAKLLHSRGFYITFVNTEYNHRRLIKSKGPESVKGLPDFKFETIPDGMPPSDELDATQDVPMLIYTARNKCLEPFKMLLTRLNSIPNEPPVSCVISDGLMSFGIRAAQEMGIPDVQLWTASVCSFVGYLHYRELIERGIVPLKSETFLTDSTLDAPLDWITGLIDMRLKDFPSLIRTTDPNDIGLYGFGEEAQSNLKASAIIFNTFDELEREALDAVVSKFNFPCIYTIGPLSLLHKQLPESEVKSLNSSLWKPDSKVFEWLDKQEPESVVYVNYGSIATMSSQHFQEFAWGLANSKKPFLWIVRPDVVKGEKSGTLAADFLDEIKDRGMLVSWCKQNRVLTHGSVGAFLTHSGWNSTLESICGGVPVISWPFFADQQTNCHYSCTKWGIGTEINWDVKRGEVEGLVREMMEAEKGKKMRKNAKEWKRMAEEATNVGGSSYVNFDKLVKEVFHHED